MTIRFANSLRTPILPVNFGTRELDTAHGLDGGFRGPVPMNTQMHGGWTLGRAGRIVLLLCFFVALAASQGMLLAQRGKKDDKQIAGKVDEKVPAVEAGGASVDPHAYKIGPEDVLSIRVWHEPDLSGAFTVRPDGKITLPLSGEVTAGGLTPVELTKVVKDAFAKLVNTPEVMVQVETVRSKKYFIVGEVGKTGAFPLVVPTTILEALNAAGGLREFANQKNIVILRGTKRIKFNYKDVIRGKSLEQNILLENGDHIVVR